jgi:3',5'-cyclic AMP phosphodiesterase CpdA
MSLRRILSAAVLLVAVLAVAVVASSVKLALFADLHAHDTDSPNEHKVMVTWPDRLNAFVDAANAWPADLVVNLGDLVNGTFVMGADLGDPARIPGILDDVFAVLTDLSAPVHHVIGNHDVYSLSKDQFLAGTGQQATFYSFDVSGFHFAVLDAQYDKQEKDYAHVAWMVQGMIPSVQLKWLAEDLAGTDLPTIVLIHQPLSSEFSLLAGGPPVLNHLAVRAVLEADGDVVAVFQGHTHASQHVEIEGIHYVTIASLVDDRDASGDQSVPPSWALVTLDPETRTLTVLGEGEQDDLNLSF